MRIKAVLRDTEILNMEAGSKTRIIAAAKKNIDRAISMQSLLKVMGLNFEKRTEMLEALSKESLHIWLAQDSQQHVIFISKGKLPDDMDLPTYQWQ